MPNVPTNQSQTYTQVPSLMSIPIIPPRTMEIPNRNAGPTNQNPFYFTQSHTQQQQQQQQAMYRPVQPNPTNFMGPLRMPQSNNQQQQWQQERNMQMIQMQQQQQRHPNPQFSQQLHPQCYSNPTPLLQYQSPYPTNPIHSTSPINSINQEANSNNESKRAARRRQYNRKKNVDEKSKDGVKCDDDANAASTSKVSGKTNLGHAMKKSK